MSTAPKGFRFATACAGFRKEGRADLALLVSDVPAVGRSGADFNPDDVVVTLCGVELFRKGQPTDLDFDALLEEPLKQRDLPIDIVLGSGSGSYTLLASDLGHEYVNVNADYRS